MWRRLARYVDPILRGERPANLCIEQATEVALDINVKTARTLGLTLPSTLVAFADEVIEQGYFYCDCSRPVLHWAAEPECPRSRRVLG